MKREYPQEELEKIWAKVRPKQIDQVQRTENLLLELINQMKTEIRELRLHIDALENPPEISIRLYSPEEMKILVANYLREKGEAFPSDIADDLRLSILDVMDAIRALQEEKKVGEV